MSSAEGTRYVGAVVGAVVGAYVGGPAGALQGASYGYALGGVAGSIIYPPDPITQQGPRLTDVRPSTADFGAPLAWVVGAGRVAAHIAWQLKLQEVQHDEHQGGKGGGGGVTTSTFTYWGACFLKFAEGPGIVRRLWADGKLVIDRSPEAAATFYPGFENAVFYDGTDDQLPDPTVESYLGAGNVPAHRRWICVCLPHIELDQFGRRYPNFTAEILTAYTTPDTPTTFNEAFTYVPDQAPITGSGFGQEWEPALDASAAINQRRIPFGAAYGYASAREVWAGRRLRYNLGPSHRASVYWRFVNHYVGGDSIAAIVRMSASNPSSGYALVATAFEAEGLDDIALYRIEGTQPPTFTELHREVVDFVGQGARTLTDTPATQWSPGHSIRLTATGTTLQAEIFVTNNAVPPVVLFSVTDTVWAPGGAEPHNFTGMGAFITSPDVELSTIADFAGETLDASLLPAVAEDVDVATLIDLVMLRWGYEYGEWNRGLIDSDVGTSSFRVGGMVILGPAVGRGVLDQLMRAFRFDVVESDWTIKMVPRGGVSPVASIPATDIGFASSQSADGTTTPALEYQRRPELELPNAITVAYFAPSRDYQTVTQQARRISVVSRAADEERIDLPLTLSDSEAKRIADAVLWSGWGDQESIQFATWRKWATLDATDNILVYDRAGVAYTARVTLVDYGADGLVKMNAQLVDFGSFRPPYGGAVPISYSGGVGGGSAGGGQVIGLPATVAVTVFEGPMIWVDRNAPELLAVAYATTGTFGGAIVQRSTDAGASWATVAVMGREGSVGVAATRLAAGRTTGIDWTSTLEVTLSGAALESMTLDDVRNGLNRALVGDEVLAFMSAELVSGNRWRLSGFQRGLRGTEWATDQHAVGERFVWLNSAVGRIQLATANIGQSIMLRTGALVGGTWSSVTRTLEGTNMRPLAPVIVTGRRT